MKKKEFIGIDVSKDKLDVSIYGSKKQSIFTNNKPGLKKMKVWMEKHLDELQGFLICFEHTGMYDLPLQMFCEKHDIVYAKVSGLHVKKSLGIQRGKNDVIDAKRLAEYAYRHRDKLKVTKLKTKQVIRLKALLSLRARLVRTRAGYLASIKRDKEFMSLKKDDLLIKTQQKLINIYSKQIDQIENEITAVINEHQIIKHQYQMATSVKGIGMITATYMIVYTNCFNDFTKWRKFACYVGSAPFDHSSGSSINGKTRISHYANKTIKALLTNAALSAIRNDPEIKQYYKRKINEGKHTKVAINNVRNKLISRVFASVNRGTPYVNTLKFAA